MKSAAARGVRDIAARVPRPRLASFTGFVLVATALAVVFRLVPQIDLWVESLFYRPGEGFYLKNGAFARFFYVGIKAATPYVVAGLIGLLLLGLVPALHRLVPFRKPALVLLACFALGSGLVVNVVFKDNWGRARPSQVTQFGGDKVFTPPFVMARQCHHNCSFVAGHPSMVFAFFGLALFARSRRRRGLAIGAVAVAGALAGLGRMIQGGHFLSDVIFSGVFMFLVAWAIFALIDPLPLDRTLPRPTAPPWLGWIRRQLRDLIWDIGELIRRPARSEASPVEAEALRGILIGAMLVLAFCFVSILWIDRPLALAIKQGWPALADDFRLISEFGESGMWLGVSAILALGFWAAARRARDPEQADGYRLSSQRALFFFVAVGGASLTVNLVKIVIGRTRPRLLFSDGVYDIRFFEFSADLWSFPSGHAATATAVAAAVYFLRPRLVWPFAIMAGLVCLARVVQTVHYLSDVVFSVYLATVFVYAAKLWFERRGVEIGPSSGPGAPAGAAAEPAE